MLTTTLRSDDWDLPEEPSPLRQPARTVAVAGAIAVVAGVFLPWMDYGINAFHASANGITGDTWGIIAMVTAGVLVAVLASRSAARSRSRAAQLVPAALGIAGVVVLWDAVLGALQLADSYRTSGYAVTYSVGLPVLAVGSLACAAGGVASSVVAWRTAPPIPPPITVETDGRVAGTTTGVIVDVVLIPLACVGGAVAGALLALNLTSGVATAGLMVILSVLGGLFGYILAGEVRRRLGG